MPHAGGRWFLAASAEPLPVLPAFAVAGMHLDVSQPYAAWQEAVELVRALRLELASARRELEEMDVLRARLAETEQEISRLPDLRRVMRAVADERDRLREQLRVALRGRLYPQLATVLEALHQAGIAVGDQACEALHLLLCEFERRPDLRAAFSDGAHLRVHDLLRWTLTAPADDPSMGVLRRHHPTFADIAKRLGRRQVIMAPVSPD
jgi:hypothetical protein